MPEEIPAGDAVRTIPVTKGLHVTVIKSDEQGSGQAFLSGGGFMDVVFSTQHSRAQHRHELRTLTYLTLDDANGGVVRNLTSGGMGAQVIAVLRPHQILRIRFELKDPRLRVETQGEVMWSTFSGQCGIRFVDSSPQMKRQIGEWIFHDLLEGIALHADPAESIFAGSTLDAVRASEEEDGLLVSESPVNVIELALTPRARERMQFQSETVSDGEPEISSLEWLSQPLSGRSLAWAIHTMVVMAGVLLFTLVFLSITREPPRWPLLLAAGVVAVISALYWVFFQFLGGTSLGARLAHLAGYDAHQIERTPRFR